MDIHPLLAGRLALNSRQMRPLNPICEISTAFKFLNYHPIRTLVRRTVE